MRHELFARAVIAARNLFLFLEGASMVRFRLGLAQNCVDQMKD
jgi:hypothetical protein